MREMEAQQCALKEEEKKLIKSLQAIQSPTVLSPPVAVTISPESTGATAKQSATPLSTQQVTQSAPSSRDRKSTRLNSSHVKRSRMPSSA